MVCEQGNPAGPDRQQMPLVSALMDFVFSDRSSWHMPGHYAGLAWPDWLKNALPQMDVTELPLTGDINSPAGPARLAMDLAATAFGAGLTRFITSGSTTALQILLALAVGRGGRLLIPRNVHQSIVHATALLGIKVSWIGTTPLPAGLSKFGLLPQVTTESVSRALEQNPDCHVILLTSPDYYGFSPDISAIAELAHKSGALLLIDEAHGAHLSFNSRLPASALHAGADACVQSGHKTLPVLTPGSMLHLSAGAIAGNRLDISRLDSLVQVFQTSSPSFPIAATLDYARALLEHSGNQMITRQFDFLDEFARSLPVGLTCLPAAAQPEPAVSFYHDPLRLVLAGNSAESPLAARQYADVLTNAGLDIEFADLTRLVLIPSLNQPPEAWQRLTDVLNRTMPGQYSALLSTGLTEIECEWRHWLAAIPEQAILPGEVLFENRQICQVSLTDAAGRISSRSILPYPPGVPLIWPGERLDENMVDFLRQLLENNISINGIDQGRLWVLV